jgi:hypothetical protein
MFSPPDLSVISHAMEGSIKGPIFAVHHPQSFFDALAFLLFAAFHRLIATIATLWICCSECCNINRRASIQTVQDVDADQ